jgi:hypothetical protein
MNAERTLPLTRRGPAWIAGAIDTPAGPVPTVATAWSRRDRFEHVRCRVSSYRDRHTVAPGLYATGRPTANAEVFVTANYKMSFDHLRRALDGIDAWILVLDTRGVNVWCAAGKGTFGTEELVRRIEAVGLARVVGHRRLIVPQLGAPGVSAHEVQRATRFRVHFGPVRASDLGGYLAGLEATPEMRRVRFGILDRMALVPMELVPASKVVLLFAAAMTVLFGIGPDGFDLGRAWARGVPVAGLGLVALISGAVVTPILLPAIPGRAFAVKGALVGVLLTAAYVSVVSPILAGDRALAAFAYLFTPAASSYLALQFTGATTFTGRSGVRKELRFALPIHLAAVAIGSALLFAHRVTAWR